MKRDADPATEQGRQKSDQDLLDDIHRLEAALSEDAGAPEPAMGNAGADPA